MGFQYFYDISDEQYGWEGDEYERERRDDDILVDELEEFAVRVIVMLLAGLFAFRKHLYYLNDHDINSNCYHFMMLNNS